MAALKIGIDARVIRKYPGLGRVCYNLIKEIARYDSVNQYIIFGHHPSLDFLYNHANFRIVDYRSPVLSMQTLFHLGRIIKREEPDVFFSPFQVTTIFTPCPLVVTVHDMMDLLYPDAFSHHPVYVNYGLRTFFRFAVPMSVAKAKKIITVSESTRQDMLGYFRNIQAENVITVLNGVEDKFRPVRDITQLQNIRKKYGLPERFILYLGSTKPYKNLHGVLNAYHKYRMMESGLTDVYLVIAGLRHFASSRLGELAERLGITPFLIHTGHVEEDDLPLVYNLAGIFLFPSIWEGFGLPALEAMACGTPVISSNKSSLPEIIGDAGIQVEPENTDDIAAAIYKVVHDKSLQEEMSGKGVARSKMFSWEDAAKKTLDILKTVGSESIAQKKK